MTNVELTHQSASDIENPAYNALSIGIVVLELDLIIQSIIIGCEDAWPDFIQSKFSSGKRFLNLILT